MSSLLRLVVLAGRLNVEGRRILEGINAGDPFYVLHHSAEYHTDPFQYRPEE